VIILRSDLVGMVSSAQKQLRQVIQDTIRGHMDRVMERVLVTDRFNEDHHRRNRPIYAALVPDQIFKAAHFERRFVTIFGRLWEELAKVVAENRLGYAACNHAVHGTIKRERLQRIQEVLNRLEHPANQNPRARPYWSDELNYIRSGGGPDENITVTCDVYAEDRSKEPPWRLAFEVKAPLPNSDQTKVSKEKLLKLYSMYPSKVDEAYLALPYNPYRSRDQYKHPYPARWFDMKKDPVVLIGDEFWDKLGGPGTYKMFIDVVKELGSEYKPKICRDFLGIEPPSGAMQGQL
jgi:hypothetical protein